MDLNFSEAEYDLLRAAADLLRSTPAKLVKKWATEQAALALFEARRGGLGSQGGRDETSPPSLAPQPSHSDIEDV